MNSVRVLSHWKSRQLTEAQGGWHGSSGRYARFQLPHVFGIALRHACAPSYADTEVLGLIIKQLVLARGPVWDARFRTRWPQGPPRGRALLPSLSTLARARRRQLLRALRAAACEDTPPLVEAHAPLEGLGELLQNVPTDGGSPAACVCHCVRKACLPSPVGLCARLPTVSTTGHGHPGRTDGTTRSCLGSQERETSVTGDVNH